MSKDTHWSNSKDVSASKLHKPILFIIKFFPAFLVHILVFPVTFFFFISLKIVRKHARNFQKQMREYTNGEVPKTINSFPQILSFAFSVVEQLEGWLGKIKYENIIKHDDDLPELISLLESGKGAYIIGSHLGNLDLLRSLSSFCKTGVSRKISVTTVISMALPKQLNNTLTKINPNFVTNVIDSDSIGPETIFALQNEVEKGGLAVIMGDRTSAHNEERCIKHKFLGKTADFPYGVFLVASLLKVPVFFAFGLRTKSAAIFIKNNMFVEKAKTDFNCSRNEAKKRIETLCDEYATTLETYCIKFPYQWYNFFDFWQNNEGEENG